MPALQNLKNRLMILALPLGMLLLWLALIASGDGRLDALGNPVGGDFAMFYIAGQMASQGEWQLLYNEPEQQRRLIALFPGLPLDTYLPYRYPPLLAIVLAPLGSLPYRTAQCLWSIGSLSVWLVSWWALWRAYAQNAFSRVGCGANGLALQPGLAPCGLGKSGLGHGGLGNNCLVGLIASPIMAQTLIDGQASFWWFAILAFAWLAIRREQFVPAGMCLALAACKPNVLLLVSVLLLVRYPRLLLGVLPTGLLMLIATCLVAGRECLFAYIELGSQLATQSWSVETPYWKVQSLLSWTQPLIGSAARPIHLAIGLSIAVAAGWWWRQCDSRRPSETDKLWNAACALSLGLLTNALFNPYTPVYDLMLLSLGMFAWLGYAEHTDMLSDWFARREVKLIIACLWVGPIVSQCLAKELACPQQWMAAFMLIALLAVGGLLLGVPERSRPIPA